MWIPEELSPLPTGTQRRLEEFLSSSEEMGGLPVATAWRSPSPYSVDGVDVTIHANSGDFFTTSRIMAGLSTGLQAVAARDLHGFDFRDARFGGLRVVDASPGSLELVLEAVGALSDWLSSSHASALANAIQIASPFAVLRGWRRSGISRAEGRQHLGRAAPAEHFLGSPDAESNIGEARGRPPVLTMPDGTSMFGSRVVFTRYYSDGTVDVIEAECDSPDTSRDRGYDL
jgi:hypothetical protein